MPCYRALTRHGLFVSLIKPLYGVTIRTYVAGVIAFILVFLYAP